MTGKERALDSRVRRIQKLRAERGEAVDRGFLSRSAELRARNAPAGFSTRPGYLDVVPEDVWMCSTIVMSRGARHPG